ncbi:MAG: tRNA lysidine(34) synthetase TilS, partial [Ignavibacteria bacterium]
MNEYLFHKINEFVKERELISPGDNLLVALSGGADSVFLLNYLLELSKKNDINFTAFHVNHNLRGEESDKDELFCKELCDDWGVDFVSVSVDVKAYAKSNSLSLEESARELRYSKLEEYAAQHNFNKIVTAHNLGDNTETVLLNLFKGKGISAIAGIPVRRGKIIRPLLGISKDEIVKELTRLNIPFRTDSSNFDNTFQRNYVRNNILPLIKENINPNVEESIGRSSEIYSNSIG